MIKHLSEIASISTPIPVMIELHPSSRNKPDPFLMHVIKVNYYKLTVTGYSEGMIMDVFDPAAIDPNNKLVNPEYFRGETGLKARKKILLHNTVVKSIEFGYESIFQVPYEKFVKTGWDKQVSYGDGGRATLIYPLFYSRCLPVPREIKTALINDLSVLGRKRKDWHDECPVLDIIDPDLAPNYNISQNNPGNDSEREKYAWFPLDVIIRSDNSLKLLGPIHNLSPRGNTHLYHSIFTVFKKMIPGFRKLGILKKRQECKLQVIVKAQKYVIAPGTSYSGKWHVEGRTENIVAGGVYYCKIDEGFEQDVVVFRPRSGPDGSYAHAYGIAMESEIDITEGCAIVFSNILPHKFLKLTNITDTPLERLFLNFFIVDPKKELESTIFYLEAAKALRGLNKLPTVLIDHILSFIAYRPSLVEAKERRKAARESMKTEVSGWGFIHYGNSGDLEFIDSSTKQSRIERYDEIYGADIEELAIYS